MKCYNSLDDLMNIEHPVVTSGTFDGVHIGHQKILRRLKEISAQVKGETVVITFWPHPRMVVADDSQNLQLISTIEEKKALLEAQGIDHLIIIPFTRSFSELSSDDFIRQVLVDKIGTQKLVIGYDHKFGRNREGSFEFLKANAATYGFEVEEIPRQDIEQTAISSSRIRKALSSGQVELAHELLGRPYALSGTVTKGQQLGRTIGFPTANILVKEAYKLIPIRGVYVIRAFYQQQYFLGMLNIGTRPTVNGTNTTIEAHLFDFDKDIYGEMIQIEFLHFLREEQKFDGLDALIAQLQVDKANSLRFFEQSVL